MQLSHSVDGLNYEVLAYLLSVRPDFDVALAVLREGCYAARLRAIRVLRDNFGDERVSSVIDQLLAICEVALDQAAHLALERLAELFSLRPANRDERALFDTAGDLFLQSPSPMIRKHFVQRILADDENVFDEEFLSFSFFAAAGSV